MAYYDVIMIHTWGHVHSENPSSGDSNFDHVQDLVRLIEELELDRPHIIGHSMEGSNVVPLATSFPHLVGKLSWRLRLGLQKLALPSQRYLLYTGYERTK